MRNPQALPSRPWLRDGPLRLNTLLWPSGASRWGVFHAVVDDAAMTAIRGATGSFGQPLVIDDGGDVVLSVTMYPLPPRPLSQDAAGKGFQLLTLIDRRAYWPWTAAEIDVVGGTTTWADLFGYLAGALDIDMDVDDVPAAYLSPPAALSGAYDSLPALLDAACLSCGLRFAAALDGTSYRCWSVAAAQAQVNLNLAGVTNPKVAGGIFLQGTDLNGIVPEEVQVVFPRADDGVPNPAPVAVPVTLASLELPANLNLPGTQGLTLTTGVAQGIGGLTKTFHSSAVATFESGSLTNSAALADLAEQAATDFYAWQATGLYDVAYAGVAPWLPTGADGLVEYAHAPDAGSGGGILSRFRRDTYFDGQESLWHHTATPCAAIPTRVRVVGTTLTDTCLYPAELVVRSGCADAAVDPPVDVWLRVDGGAPAAGDVHLASPEGVRAADGLPVYVARAGGGGTADLSFSGATLTLVGGGLSVPANTATVVDWSLGAYDTDSYYTSGLPTRLTVPAAGYYRVTGRATWFIAGDSVPAGRRFLWLRKNGSGILCGEVTDFGPQNNALGVLSFQASQGFSQVFSLAAGDYLEVLAQQITSVSWGIVDGNAVAVFQVERVVGPGPVAGSGPMMAPPVVALRAPAPPSSPGPSPVPSGSAPALARPVVRNLLYHLYPRAGGGWQWNVGELLKRAGLFNGRKVIAVVTDATTDDPREVRRALGPLAGSAVFLANNPGLREVASFGDLFSRVNTVDPSHCTFYWHSKGVTHPDSPAVRRWAEMTFSSCLDYWPLCERLLDRYPVVGSFKRHGKVWVESESVWHYSGSAFWFRNRDLFSKPDWRRIDRFWSGVEPYPSLHFGAGEAGCLFWEWHDTATKGLYEAPYVAAVAREYVLWQDRQRADYREWGRP